MNEIEIGDGEEAEFIVCSLLSDPLILSDNIISVCCKCGELIQHRPHIPKGLRTVCMPCMIPDMNKEAAKGDLQVVITPETAEDLRVYFRKKNAN
jgi:hypothetical protein